jgi:hypothetical protein
MVKAKKRAAARTEETDSVYFLKLVGYFVVGTWWLKFTNGQSVEIGLPIGFIVGLLLAAHDHIQLDRKIGYAVLLVSMMLGYWLPLGLYINF